MIHVGTSGYGYHDWTPTFYPRGLVYEDYLRYYSERFTCCELNSTYFRMPRAKELELLLRRSEGRLVFTLKAHRRLTHQREKDMDAARRFASMLSPLVDAGKLGAVLAQFPFSFINNPAHRAYVCRLRAALDLPVVAEFRNDGWHHRETLDFLRGWGIGLAAVDGPKLEGLPAPHATATSKLGYVRFHGRCADRWWNKDGASRYDYNYRRRELLGWIPRLKEMARQSEVTFVVFNNHWRGQSVANALTFRKIVERSRSVKSGGRAATRRAG
jgi:uncharacterized protein YecE (DUF72 family)